jgi:hypothetical protein
MRQAGREGDPFGKLRAGSSLRLKNGCAQDGKDNKGPNCAITHESREL